MRALPAKEPPSCREVFAEIFRALRLHVEVITTEPDDLEGEAPWLRPDVVVCNRIMPTLDENGTLLMPTSDTYRTNPGLETLLAFIARNEGILENYRDTGGRR